MGKQAGAVEFGSVVVVNRVRYGLDFRVWPFCVLGYLWIQRRLLRVKVVRYGLDF